MTPSAVIQVKRGIGDVIWHLPFVRAIAAVAPGQKVTFLAPPSSGAKELLAAEPGVAEVRYFEHAGSELQLYVSPVNWRPDSPPAPMSFPASFSAWSRL